MHRWVIAAVGMGCAVRVASAQPLERFLASARERGFDVRIAREEAQRAGAEAGGAWTALLPRLGAEASWTFNQFTAEPVLPGAGGVAGRLVIVPRHQFDAVASVSLPLVDVAAWRRVEVARSGGEAARARADAVVLESAVRVTRLFHELAGARAVAEAARRAIRASIQFVELTRARRDAGSASGLDEARASAELAVREASLSDAARLADVAARSLETATGLAPGDLEGIAPDTLAEESPMDRWLEAVSRLPSVRAARQSAELADRNAAALRAELYPRASASVSERFTNATGFIGENALFSGGVAVSWALDPTLFVRVRALEHVAAGAQIEAERVSREAGDRIFDAWTTVRALVAGLRADRAATSASALAARLVRERFEAGAATSFEVLGADRELFEAEARVERREAALVAARRVLRLVAGVP